MKKFCKEVPLYLGWIGSVLGLYSVCEVYKWPQWVVPVGVFILGILYVCGLAGLKED